jgi:hypothetical protein
MKAVRTATGIVVRDDDGDIHAVISRHIDVDLLLRLLRELEPEQMELRFKDEEQELFPLDN